MSDPAGAPELVPTLRVRVSDDTVRLELAVANADTAPVHVTFGSSQRYDFVVLDEGGVELWRWSADRMFAQALSEDVVPAGAVLEYHEEWPDVVAGRFRAVARFESIDHPLELVAEFEVPAE